MFIACWIRLRESTVRLRRQHLERSNTTLANASPGIHRHTVVLPIKNEGMLSAWVLVLQAETYKPQFFVAMRNVTSL
jgi:hypothetical protein